MGSLADQGRLQIQLACQKLIAEANVQEARPGHLHGLSQVVGVKAVDHLDGESAGIGLRRLGRRHYPVGLVVAVLGPRRDLDQGRRLDAALFECGLNAGGQKPLDVHGAK